MLFGLPARTPALRDEGRCLEFGAQFVQGLLGCFLLRLLLALSPPDSQEVFPHRDRGLESLVVIGTRLMKDRILRLLSQGPLDVFLQLALVILKEVSSPFRR